MNSPSRNRIRQILREEFPGRPMDNIKKSVFKFWDKQKSKGIKPEINTVLATSVGLHNTSILEDWIIEWYGGEDIIFSRINKELVNKVLTTDDVEKLGIEVGGYNFSFKLYDIHFSESRHGGYVGGVLFDVIKGSVILAHPEEEYDLNDTKNIPDELWNVLEEEIKDIISDLIRYVSKSFGIYDIEGLYLDWN